MSLGQFTPTPYALLLGAAATALVGLSLVTLRNRSRRAHLLVTGILLATAVWCGTYAMQLSSTDAATAAFWNTVRTVGPAFASPLLFLFAAEYTNRDGWLRRRRVAALLSLPVVTTLLALTNDVHHLVRRDIGSVADGGPFTEVVIGPWAPVYASYNYVLWAAAVYLLARAFRDGRQDVYRGQAGAMLVAVVVPGASNVAYFLGLTTFDTTPLTFTVTGFLFAVALYRYRLLDILPIARSTVFDNVESGVVVLDADGTVVDANERAGEIAGVDPESLIGTATASASASDASALDRLVDARDDDRVEVECRGERRWYDVDVSPIRGADGRHVGRVVMVTDVTDRVADQRALERRTRDLQRQNDRLEEMASIVSHDLRNPINVMEGHLELVREDGDPRHYEAMAESLDRMQALVEETLTMARHGQHVTDPEAVDLATVAEEAWRHVETGTATLRNDAAGTVTADRDRLLGMFENLFRNAVEHGSPSPRSPPAHEDAVEHGFPSPPSSGTREDAVEHSQDDGVTVRVGPIDAPASDGGSAGAGAVPGGFVVEDDGPGIPEADRERVFEQGYTTADGGTGFGLAIVKAAAEAHGWSVEVTASEDGGARFEVRTD